jgi:FkbH-like protein
LGQGDPEGEAFLEFQRYIKCLRQRGVILAVCSKNSEAIAQEVFEKHPESVLRLDDISSFVANWDDKAANLARIARELNIGMNSLVFVDDNPTERSIVRRLCPEVAVPEIPEDPAYYIRAIDRHRYFPALTVSSEDLQRTQFYRANASRHQLGSSAEDLNSFLASLVLVGRIEPICPASLERSAQLISRSNQFNLTTRRRSNGELLSMIADPDWLTMTVSLEDRFGDNGLISVVLAKIDRDTLAIDTWLMSCRVLKRGVEQFLLNHLVACARERGLTRVLGEFIATPKNELVRDHYAGLGFSQIGGEAPGYTVWELRLDDTWQPLPNFIREASHDGSRSFRATRCVSSDF